MTLTQLAEDVPAEEHDQHWEREERFARAVTQHLPALRRRALFLMRDRSRADDLVQDTLERALRNAERWTAGTNLQAWLFTIQHNLFIDHCRGHRLTSRRPALLLTLVDAAREPAPIWETLTSADVLEACRSLDPRLREVFVLVAIEQRSYQDAARMLGIPVATVGTRIHRARGKLRSLLCQTLAGSGPEK
jgi:RNA polymerase sigma-70 factor (ECF subfamily)